MNFVPFIQYLQIQSNDEASSPLLITQERVPKLRNKARMQKSVGTRIRMMKLPVRAPYRSELGHIQY